jgi:hypothetical protein
MHKADQKLIFEAVLHGMSAADFYGAAKRHWDSSASVRQRFLTSELFCTHVTARFLDVHRQAQAAADDQQRTWGSS